MTGGVNGLGEQQPGRTRAVGSVLAIVTAGQLPAFLTGALAVQIREDLGFSVARLGLAVGIFFVAAAAGSGVLGGLVERIGWRAGMRLAVAASTISLLGVSGAARSWTGLVVFLLIGGAGNAIAQPAANLSLARLVPAASHGLVFGVKQSAIPLATLLGGLAVPLVALTIGWRWTYVIAAIAAVLAATGIPRGSPEQDLDLPPNPSATGAEAARRSIPSLRPLVLLAVAGGLGAMVGNSLGAFLVSSSVEAGVDPGAAGILLAVGSVVGLAMRVGLGWAADRFAFQPTHAMSLLLVIGALGCLLLARQQTAAIVGGTLLGFGAGWAWPGLFHLAVVRSHSYAPATATGISQTGVFLGAAAGPILFGAVVEGGGYGPAWMVTAALASASACLAMVASRELRGARRMPARTVGRDQGHQG